MMMADRQIGRSLGAIFRMPLLIAIATIVGLVAGLLGGGGWDALAAVALAAPVVAYLVNDRVKRRR